MKQKNESTGKMLAKRVPVFRGQMDIATRHYVLRSLAWIWSMLAAMALLSMYFTAQAWPAHLLVIGGAIVSVAILGRARMRRRRLQPVPHLSRGCNTVWQLDREG